MKFYTVANRENAGLEMFNEGLHRDNKQIFEVLFKEQARTAPERGGG